MINSFFASQQEESKQLYVELLKVTGSLSNLFSESNVPFLYYRAMENIFSKAFKATNLSRSDISVDASKHGIGIGLKTFLQCNGKTFQKVAEFNSDSHLLKDLDAEKLILKISELRNERITSTMRMCDLKHMMYHLITRDEHCMSIYEEHMSLVDIPSISNVKQNKNIISFNDKYHEYKFNIAKSTLLKRFHTPKNKSIFSFEVNILDDPYDFLLSANTSLFNEEKQEPSEIIVDYIVLPLYSPRTLKVEEHSGLNQWNARGRERHEDEVYIPIPNFIHTKKRGFFEYNTKDFKTKPFEVNLPNGKTLSMKVAQQGGKALMSNPNRALGNWILREILQLKPLELVTKEQLDSIGIDSVKLSKSKDNQYYLDFLKTGSFEKFKQKLFDT